MEPFSAIRALAIRAQGTRAILVPVLLLSPTHAAQHGTNPGAPGSEAAAGTIDELHSGARRSSLPTGFLENKGQWPAHVRYATVSGHMRPVGTDHGLLLGTVARPEPEQEREFLGIRPIVSGLPTVVSGNGEAGGHSHFLIGPLANHTVGAREFQRLTWITGADPGGSQEDRVVMSCTAGLYGWTLGFPVGETVLELSGILSASVGPQGALLIHTEQGRLLVGRPRREAASEQERELEEASFDVVGKLVRVRVRAPSGIPSQLFSADLTWSSAIGGADDESANQVVLDSSQRVLVAGSAWSLDFPSTPGAMTYTANQDGFLTKVDPALDQHVFTAFFGGHGYDDIRGLALVGGDRIAIAGATSSSDMPTTPGVWDDSFNGTFDGFYAKLRADGSQVLTGTYVGGSLEDRFTDMAVDGAEDATIVGYSYSANYPVTPGAADTTYSSPWSDGVVTRIRADGTVLHYSTYLGGSSNDNPYAVALEPTGNAVIAGRTISGNFPITPGTMSGSPSLGFVTKLNASGQSIVASTYFGGTDDGFLYDVAIGPLGRIYVVGWTRSFDFPVTPGAYDTVFGGTPYDGIVSILHSDLSDVAYSTFLGASGSSQLEEIVCLAVDKSGVVTVGGTAGSYTYPVTPGAFQSSISVPNSAAVVSRLDPTLSELLYSSYLGGVTASVTHNDDRANAVAVFPDGSAVFVGSAGSIDFPLTSTSVQPGVGGKLDAFATVMQLSPLGTQRYGATSSTCSSVPWIGVNRMPVQSDSGFAFTASEAPPSSVGVLAIGTASAPSGVPVLGVSAFIDPGAPFLVLGAVSESLGWCKRNVSLPAGSQGVVAYGQFLWFDPSICAGGAFSATNAMAITIQP